MIISHQSRWMVVWILLSYFTQGIFVDCKDGIPSDKLPSVENEAETQHLLKNYDEAGLVQQFEKISERSVRSTTDCQNVTSSATMDFTYGDDVNLTCTCEGNGYLAWFDQSCREVTTSLPHIYIAGGQITIKTYNKNDSSSYQCTYSGAACRHEVFINAKERVTQQGNAAAGVVICIILALIAVISLCCCRKYKTKISLCFRDTCRTNDGRDGKVYDAYVSTGLSETDRRFVESLIRDVLRKKCGYNVFVDDKNILPRLDYSDKVQANLHKCRRLIVVFSASYMTHDWCMYCFNEGLRKIVDLAVPTIFIITDHSILSELRTHADIVAHIPQILLTPYQTTGERQEAIDRIRQRMPPPMRRGTLSTKSGMRSPMLSDAESIHKSDVNFNTNGTATYTEVGTEYTFGSPADDAQLEYDEPEQVPEGPDDYVTAVQTGEELDPNKVKVHEYGARKDFYSLTMPENEA